MAGRKRSHDDHHPGDQETKRAERVRTSGEEGSVPHKSSREATAAAGEEVVKHPHHAPEVDAESASKAFGIDQSAQRDAGVSIPDSPYQKRG